MSRNLGCVKSGPQNTTPHSIRPPLKATCKATKHRNGVEAHTHREIVWVCRPVGTDVRLRLVQCVWKSPPLMTREHCADTAHTRPRAINSVGSPAKHGGIPSRALAAKHEKLIHTLCAIKSFHQIIKCKTSLERNRPPSVLEAGSGVSLPHISPKSPPKRFCFMGRL